jgi:hypothetical protein
VEDNGPGGDAPTSGPAHEHHSEVGAGSEARPSLEYPAGADVTE